MRGRSSSDWQDKEYARLMGSEALERQQAAAKRETRVEQLAAKCNCGWKMGREHILGPHHSQSCPKWTKETPE